MPPTPYSGDDASGYETPKRAATKKAKAGKDAKYPKKKKI